MEIITKTHEVLLTQEEINILEEEMFNLHLWDDNRDSPLNKHKIQRGDYPNLDKLYSLIKRESGGASQ